MSPNEHGGKPGHQWASLQNICHATAICTTRRPMWEAIAWEHGLQVDPYVAYDAQGRLLMLGAFAWLLSMTEVPS